MTSEVKLLTVQMAEALGAMSPEARVRMLRERGLIAPEPDAIDRLRDALEAIHGITLDRDKMARVCREARMELRPPLTRERVGEAFAKAASLPFQRSEDYYGITIDRLHAALTEPQP